MAFAYSSKVEMSLPLSYTHGEKFIELGDEYIPTAELPAEDIALHELPAEHVRVHSPFQRRPEKAPRPNKASRAFRHAQLAARQFIQQRRRRAGSGPRDDRLPLSVIELILAHLDVRGAARGSEEVGLRAPGRPCPTAAEGLYDRLVHSRDVARWQRSTPFAAWLIRSFCDPAAHRDAASCVTWQELPRLLEPVIAEMKECLSYMEAFQSRLDLETEGCDYWIDLSRLRQSVFSLTGFWPHDIEHDDEAWAFGLPDDLTRLLYPQCGKLDHAGMSFNLDQVIVGPAWDKLLKLEATVHLYQRYCS